MKNNLQHSDHKPHKSAVRLDDPSSDPVFGGNPSLQLRAALPFMPDDMRLTSREVAMIVSPHHPNVLTVYQLRKKGALRSIKVGKHRWFRAADVRAYFEGDVDNQANLTRSVANPLGIRNPVGAESPRQRCGTRLL